MRKAELKTFWHSTPFVPFNIVLARSERLPVPRPDFLSLSPVRPMDELRSFGEKDIDHTSVDVMLIKAVETARNGSKNRRRGSR